MKAFMLLAAMLLTLAGGLAACGTPMQGGGDAQKSAVQEDTDAHARGGY